MTVYYSVAMIDTTNVNKIKGLFKIRGKWFNCIDVAIEICERFIESYYMSKEFVDENIEELINIIQEKDLPGLYMYLSDNLGSSEYLYEDLFFIAYEKGSGLITLKYSNMTGEKHIFIETSKYDKNKIESITFFDYPMEEHTFRGTEINIKTLQDLKRFESLRSFERYLRECIKRRR